METIEKSPLNNCSRIIENESGLHFLLRLDTTRSDQEISEKLKIQGIKVRALSEYFLTAPNGREHYFIINYSSIDADKIPEVCEKIYDLIQ